jgi:hypothetical protein
MRQMRHGDVQVIFPPGNSHLRVTVVEDRLFNKKDPPVFCKSADQMLRPLINEIPTKVRKADHVLTCRETGIVRERINYHIDKLFTPEHPHLLQQLCQPSRFGKLLCLPQKWGNSSPPFADQRVWV